MEAIWTRALNSIKALVTTENFNTYFKPLRLAESPDGRMILEVDDSFFADWVREHYFDLLNESVKQAADREIEIEIITKSARPIAPAPPKKRKQARTRPAEIITPAPRTKESTRRAFESVNQIPVNPSYTFSNFIVGPANQMAHAASVAAAENPANAFNPLFLYGNTGLGKTHLLHAIAHSMKTDDPSIRILYLSAEEFTNQVIKSIQRREMDALREQYRRNCDVLLMDDIHVLAGKEATQEEFFHTFNALHAAQKQIILTSDRPPQDISRLEERLRSRFQWGLITDIKPPAFETRVAILNGKAERDGIQLPDDVAHFLAHLIHANVRELEGALIRLSAFASFNRSTLTVDFAREVLREIFERSHRQVNMDFILETVAEHFEVTVQELIGKRRHRSIAHPRSVAMYLCRKHVQASFPQIGRRFGGKDHSTVIAACKKIDKAIENDQVTQRTVSWLEKKLGS